MLSAILISSIDGFCYSLLKETQVVVSTPLKYIRQMDQYAQVGVRKKYLKPPVLENKHRFTSVFSIRQKKHHRAFQQHSKGCSRIRGSQNLPLECLKTVNLIFQQDTLPAIQQKSQRNIHHLQKCVVLIEKIGRIFFAMIGCRSALHLSYGISPTN